MAVTNDDKLDLLLLVCGEELQKLTSTLPEQLTIYASHIEKLDQHFKAIRSNTLKLYKLFNTERSVWRRAGSISEPLKCLRSEIFFLHNSIYNLWNEQIQILSGKWQNLLQTLEVWLFCLWQWYLNRAIKYHVTHKGDVILCAGVVLNMADSK